MLLWLLQPLTIIYESWIVLISWFWLPILSEVQQFLQTYTETEKDALQPWSHCHGSVDWNEIEWTPNPVPKATWDMSWYVLMCLTCFGMFFYVEYFLGWTDSGPLQPSMKEKAENSALQIESLHSECHADSCQFINADCNRLQLYNTINTIRVVERAWKTWT